MRTFALIVLLAVVLPATAQRTYAILSLVGDRIDIVQRVGPTGTSLDRNRKDSVPLEDHLIDRAILAAADRAIRRELRDAKPVLLMANDPGLYRAQDEMLEDEASVTALLAPLRATLGGANATHLLLFTRYRHAAYFVLGNAHVGTGMIDGAGFYVDSRLMTRRSDTQEKARGFMAPYVYFQATLVDLASGSIVKQKPLLASNTLSAARAESGNSWDSLTLQQKIDALVRLASREASGAARELIATP